MSANTTIEWTDRTWNPVRGCSRVSPGCDNCYAMGQAHRFNTPSERSPYHGLTTIRRGKVDWMGVARLVPSALAEPLRWRKPQRIFVNSMSDPFHLSLSNEEIAAVFGVMAACLHLTFQVLTKRPERAREWFKWAEGGALESIALDKCASYADDQLLMLVPRAARAKAFAPGRGAQSWPLPNVWLGTSVENQKTADERIPLLLQCPAAVRFISAEPLLGPVDLRPWIPWRIQLNGWNGPVHFHTLTAVGGRGLDWVIVGGESGPGARPCDIAWLESVVEQCRAAGVPVFCKQLGAKPLVCGGDGVDVQRDRDQAGLPIIHHLRDRKGGDWNEWPERLRVREFPRGTT